MKAAQIIKKKSQWKWVQKPFNRSHLPLNNCKFPLGPMGEGLSVPLPPYLSPPYFSMLSGSLSTQPPASSHWACGEAGLLGPPLFWPGRKVQREPWKLECGNIKKERKRKKNFSHCFIKWQPFTSKHIRNSPLSEAVISNLETLPPQDILFQFSQQLWILRHLIFIVSAFFPISQRTLSSLSLVIKCFICRVILLLNELSAREVNI